MDTPKEFLANLGLSDSEIQLYLAMTSRGALRAAELVQITGGKRPTVYYALRQLLDRGLVRHLATQGAKRFQAEPPEKLLTLLDLRTEELRDLKERARDMLPRFAANKIAHEGLPSVNYFEGKQAMKQIVMETLYCKSKHIDTIAPKDNFFWQIGQTFSQRYINERVHRGITTRNLWEEPLKPELMLKSYKGLSEVRILPKIMYDKFRTTIFLYDDKVMYISSIENAYVLLVQSQEHHECLKAMYEGLWAASDEAI